MNIIGHDFTFFDIQSTKAKQYGFYMDLGNGKKLYFEEGAQYYHGNLFIPDDLESIVL